MKLNNQTYDLIALTSSVLCAIHCVAVPIVLSFSALGSLHFLGNPWIEWSFILFGLLLVLVSLWPSYLKIHGSKKPFVFASIGFFFIAIGRLDFSAWWETGNTVLGAFMVAYAHYRNWKLLREKPHRH
ncbi:MerC domain-containing protein [Pricia sp.]|uniref:MerC domain-containing protein n=1 Tax=Pricia sp. TaxID=2268138 RepID=UPI003592EFB2